MEELNIKIKDISFEIINIQVECDKLLDYGNPPSGNYDKVLELLTKRSKLKDTLSQLEETRDTIISNKLSIKPE
jgi:hypothetical protein